MADGGGGSRKHSCNSAIEILEWIRAIVDFLEPYRFFLDAHIVNFFKDRMWEAVDKDWMDCLRKEPVEKLLEIPSGIVQAFPGLIVASLNNVIAQGMNQKKKHEIEVLAAVIGSTARRVGANTIVDVGSGQGYLAQVLSFEHELSVIAIDASAHHGRITNARAKRMEKYYVAKTCKSREISGGTEGSWNSTIVKAYYDKDFKGLRRDAHNRTIILLTSSEICSKENFHMKGLLRLLLTLPHDFQAG